MTEDEVVERLGRAAAYLATTSEEALRDLGVTVFPDAGQETPRRNFEAELKGLLCREQSEGVSPSELRRIAELVEAQRGEEEAFGWWSRAAQAGDEDARFVLETFPE